MWINNESLLSVSLMRCPRSWKFVVHLEKIAMGQQTIWRRRNYGQRAKSKAKKVYSAWAIIPLKRTFFRFFVIFSQQRQLVVSLSHYRRSLENQRARWVEYLGQENRQPAGKRKRIREFSSLREIRWPREELLGFISLGKNGLFSNFQTFSKSVSSPFLLFHHAWLFSNFNQERKTKWAPSFTPSNCFLVRNRCSVFIRQNILWRRALWSPSSEEGTKMWEQLLFPEKNIVCLLL